MADQLSITFSDSAQDEVGTLVRELQLIPVATFLQSEDAPIPEGLKEAIKKLLSTLSDFLSVDLPAIEKDPETTLRVISRDINLARLLRERGLFRLYRLVNQKVPIDSTGNITESGFEVAEVPMFMLETNPVTGARFMKQEEFIGWFCSEAKVARSLVFGRLATIDRMITIGFSLEEAYSLLITKPYAIREALNMVANWEKGELVSINPDVAIGITRKVSPELEDEITAIADAARGGDEDAQEELRTAIKPVLADMLTNAANHERSKDAMDYIKHDVLAMPEITYEWDEEQQAIVTKLYKKAYDTQSGIEITTEAIVVPWVPDTFDLPAEIVTDLLKRLPIKNRHLLDLDK